jgi:hypothetical protein
MYLLFLCIERNVRMVHEQSPREIGECPTSREQDPEHINRKIRIGCKQFVYRDTRMSLDMGKRECFELWVRGNLVCPEVLEKLLILNFKWVKFGRGTQTIGEAELLGICFPWWTVPLPGSRLLITSGLVCGLLIN